MGMKLSHLLKFITLLILFVGSAFAQNPTKWILDSDSKGKSLKSGESVSVKVKADVEGEWHLYSLEQPKGGPIATTIKVADGSQFEMVGKAEEVSKPKVQPDPNFMIDGKPLETRFFTKGAEFTVALKALADVAADSIALDVRFQLCNDTVCLPPRTKRVNFVGEEDVKKPVLGSQSSVSSAEPTADQPIITREQPKDIWAFIWLAATLGALSLLTPCVFPMIPITVSYFTNH